MTGMIGMSQNDKLIRPHPELKDITQILNLPINPRQNPLSENLPLEVQGPPPTRRW